MYLQINGSMTLEQCISTFLTHEGAGLKIKNCYALGTVKRENGDFVDTYYEVNKGLDHMKTNATASTTFANYN